MPGQTNNTTLLAAENQLILTQNEQSVKLDEIEAAILSLKGAISTGGGAGQGGESGGSTGPSGIQDLVGLDVDDDLSPEQRAKRCLVANYVFDTLRNCIDDLDKSPFEISLPIAASMVDGTIALLLAYGAIAGFVAISAGMGAIVLSAIVAAVILSVDLGEIVDELDDNRQFVVNGLYNSKNIYQAKKAIMDNVDLGESTESILTTLAAFDLLGKLFQDAFEPPADYIPNETTDCALSDWYYVRKNPVATDIVYCDLPGRSFDQVSNITTDLIQLVVPDTGLTDILITYGSQTSYMIDTARYNLYINGSLAISNAFFSGRAQNCSRTINYTGATEITSAQLEILHQTGIDPTYDHFYYAISSVVFS